jgi:4-hydroxy-3-methylbut-2-enyl diphosphate reductase
MELHLAKPRGFCAGVERAIEIVEKALNKFGAPIYVRHEIVHNAVVVEELKAKGAVFIDDLNQVPSGSWLIFSAHGVPPQVVATAKERKLQVIDATCPLVTKVHLEARHFAQENASIFLVGHRKHVEVEGVVGEAPEAIFVIESAEEAEVVQVPNSNKVAALTQTTLSVDEAKAVIDVLKRRFPKLALPHKDDICYATQNRQDAVRRLAPSIDLLLVIGDKTSSNSNRLRELGESLGVPSKLLLSSNEIEEDWFEGVKRIGITSGASTPEISVDEVMKTLAQRGVRTTRILDHPGEGLTFSLPELLRK